MAVVAAPVDKLVVESVFVSLDSADLTAYIKREAKESDAAIVEAIGVDEEALERLSNDHYVDGAITRAEFFSARKALQARLEGNRARLARSRGEGMRAAIVGAGAEVRRQWEARPLDWKRAVITSVVDHIDIMPTKRGRRPFDVERVRPVWRF
jgi:hypothetical protein